MTKRGSARASLAFVTALITIAGCESAPTMPDSPSAAILDAVHGENGNPNFYFQPPMVPAADPGGVFDESLSPVVQVCIWDGSSCVAGGEVAYFTTQVGTGSETVRVVSAEEHYVVNWHTDALLDQYTLPAGHTFRVRVLVNELELGYADLAVVSSGRELKNVDTEEYVPLKDGRTLPIKFRIEEGALDHGSTDDVDVVGSGGRHSCAVRADGTAFCWGDNSVGQLGTGLAGGSFNTPQQVLGGATWAEIQAGRFHTCGRTTGGEIKCWGTNNFGQLGDGGTDAFPVPHPTPTTILNGGTFSSLATLAGFVEHTCGVKADGSMLCWGLNAFGQIGTGTPSLVEATPALVDGAGFSGTVAIGQLNTCALTTAGAALCWGDNRRGDLGQGGTDNARHDTPAAVGGGHTYTSLAVGASHACGVTTAGAVLCWGRGDNGALGIGPTATNHPTPTAVSTSDLFSTVSTGVEFTCGVRSSDGAGICWGANGSGQLGLGFFSPREFSPGPVTGSNAFQAINAGVSHTCGVTSSAEVLCWGRGFNGQLGHGSTSSSSIPVTAAVPSIP